MDYVWDSASILTSFREELSKSGVIFCSMSEAVREYPDLVRQHLGSVVRWHLTAKCSAKCCRVAGRQTPVGEPLRLSGKTFDPVHHHLDSVVRSQLPVHGETRPSSCDSRDAR